MLKLLKKIMKYLVDLFNEVFHWCHQRIGAPTLLTATFMPPNVELAWTDNATNEDCYMIWRSTDGTNFTLIDTINIEDLESYSDTTAAAGVLYYYKVQACNSNGDTSDFSNTVQVTNTLTSIKYGYLYNWLAVDDVRGMAPTGWHIPTRDDWKDLLFHLDADATSAVNDAGGYLKEISIYWAAPNTGATNSTYFNARGTGLRGNSTGNFTDVTKDCGFWSSTNFGVNDGYIARLTYDTERLHTYDGITHVSNPKNDGRPIRYIKDDAVNPGTVADYDGNIYGCVTIGTQVWTDRNAIVTHYNNGDEIPYEDNAADWAALVTGARCLYNNSWAYL